MQTMLTTLLTQALSNAPELVLTLVLAILSPFLLRWIRANASKAQLELMIKGADIVYPVVDAAARATPGGLDDKAVAGFDVFRKGLRLALSKKDEPKLRAIFTAKKEEERKAAVVDLAVVVKALSSTDTQKLPALRLDPDLAPRVSGVSSIQR